MEFLNKLYESNYFGIGLFAVISFLVVTFLVVLFFGKKDEQKRKLENTSNNANLNNDINGFKEINNSIPLEVPVAPIEAPVSEVVAPVSPVEPVAPVQPVNYEESPVTPTPIIEPVNNMNPVPAPVETPVTPIIEPVSPIINEQIVTPQVAPVTVEPVKINIPSEILSTPKTMEPIKIVIPDAPVQASEPIIAPIIKEEVAPIVTPTFDNNRPVIEEKRVEPIINNSVTMAEEVKVPKIDFDAIAESISKELDELEKSTVNNNYEDIKVTPINEIATPEVKQPVNPTPVHASNQFSSVYVTPQQPQEIPVVDIPKKIDLPTKRSE